MKNFAKFLATSVIAMCAMCMSAQQIEKKVDYNGGKVYITNAEKLFSDCKMRMAAYVTKGETDVVYAIELDLTDRVETVSKGNLLTITFKDDSTIQLENCFDTQAEVTETHGTRIETDTETAYVSGIGRWGHVFGHPVSATVTHEVPTVETTSFAQLYYKVTPDEIEKIINGKVVNISIVTDKSTITKKARPFSEAVASLVQVLKRK